MDGIPVIVAEDLNFDMPGGGQEFLDQDPVIPESTLCLTARRIERRDEIGLLLHDPHATATTAGRRLDQHRKADITGSRGKGFHGLVFAVIPRHQRHTCGLHDILRCRLVAHRPHGIRARPDKGDPRPGTGLGEPGILGQETVAGMNGIRARCARRRNHCIDIQIALGRCFGADIHRFIGGIHMHRAGIGIRIDSNDVDSQAPRGACHAHGDLAAICNKQSFDHVSVFPSTSGFRA